jgi:UPF0755 protein
MMRVLVVVTTLAVVAVSLSAAWVARLLEPASDDPMAPTHTFEIAAGSSLGAVSRGLESAGMIKDARAMNWLARLQERAGRLHVGEYEVSPTMTPDEILDMITTGRVKLHSVTVPEGLRASEIAVRLEASGLIDDAQAFLEVVMDPAFVESLGIEERTLEGYLFPDTYRMAKGLPEREVARAFVDQFMRVWGDLAPLAEERGLSMHDVVTLASIVEKETGDPAERPLIAAVFLNRLDKGMRLETDPTVIYGIEDFDGNIKKRHLLDASNPYNTYRHAGLPPGPIASPGREALRAVVEPADSDYLYFVSMNDGTHQFSRTYREHVNAVNRYQKRRRSK